VNGQPTVYLFTENLWRALGAPLPRGLPPLADEHVFARALHVGTPKRLTFAGERVPEVTQITRTDLPIDPKSMDPRRGREQKPTVEWHGTFADGRRELLDDAKMGPYVHGLISLKFEELLGELSPRDAERLEMDNPLWSAILEQDKGESFTLVMSRIQAGQQRTVVNMATKQMFSITNETADTLLDVPVVVKTEEEDQGSETDAGEAQTEDSGQAAELRNR